MCMEKSFFDEEYEIFFFFFIILGDREFLGLRD